jgi:hypothetical protein
VTPRETTEMIADLTKENYILKKELKQYKDNVKLVKSMLVSIGGPLNDNYHQYNKDQLKIFWTIDRILNDVSYEEEYEE